MSGLTGLGRALSPALGQYYGRSNILGRSVSPLRNLLSNNLSQDLDNPDDILSDTQTDTTLQSLNPMRQRDSSLFDRFDTFDRHDNLHNPFVRHHKSYGDHDSALGRINDYHNPFTDNPMMMSSSDFFSMNDPLSNSFNNNKISFTTSFLGNDALQIIAKIKNIIKSPEAFQYHKDNGTLPPLESLNHIYNNAMGQVEKLAKEKVNTASDSGDTFGGLKDMFRRNMQQKDKHIQDLIDNGNPNTLLQDMPALEEAVKHINRV